MKAIVIEGQGPDAQLVLRDVPEPCPGPAELLVAVRAAALNRADLRRAVTHFAHSDKSPRASIAGLEMAGEVIGLGAEVRGLAVGDRVMAMAGASYAEQVCIDHRLAVPVPISFTWQQAAATPITFITAHDALTSAAALKPGESVLIQGGSTGAGIAAIQIAKLKGANTVFATAGVAEKLARLSDLGCDVAIDYRTQDFAAVVQERTAGRGVEVVIDIVGGAAAQGNIDAVSLGGRIVCLGRVAGAEAKLNLDEFSRKRAHMIGVTFRTRSLAERIAAVRHFCEDLLPALADGRIRPVIDCELPLAQAAEAQEYMRANRHFGKIILRV